MKLKFVFTLVITALAVISATGAKSTPTYDSSTRSVSNWESQAAIHLGITDEALTKNKYPRCVKLNNYWCLKDVGWAGSVGRDNDRHTAFLDGNMAARAAVRNFRTAYLKHGRKTAFQIMSVYAPPDDCVGSKAGTRKDGSCVWGKNPTEKYAISVASGVARSSSTDLFLFDSDGVANEDKLVKFLQNMALFELGGLTVSADTIKRGICLENSTCKE